MPDSPPRWLDLTQQRLWRAYLDGTTRFVETLARDHELHSAVSLNEYELLVRLSESPERTMRMSALADGLARSRSRITHTVARMEARGLVARCALDGDRRGVNCTLTDEGFRVLQEAAPGHVAAVRRYLVDVLTPEQFEALGTAMAAVAEACRNADADAVRPADADADRPADHAICHAFGPPCVTNGVVGNRGGGV